MATETSRETNPISSEKPPSSPLMPFADSRRLFSVRPFSIIGETIELEVASAPSEEGEPLWGGGRSWLNPCRLLGVGGRGRSEQPPQLHVLAPVAWGQSRPCQGPQGGGPTALTWFPFCHCPSAPSLSAICMTKSSRPSKDCPGRVRTPVGFSSPSVGSRNPAPSSCESPPRLRVPPPQVQRLPPLLPGPITLHQLLQTLHCLAVPFSHQQLLSSVALVIRSP